MNDRLNVGIWDEYPGHAPKDMFPNGIRGAVAEGIAAMDVDGLLNLATTGLDEPNQGITEEFLAKTDVLFWWGHARHDEVTQATADRVARHVKKRGMGFVCLHSGHYSKPFQTILDCTGDLKGGWREAEPSDVEEISVCAPRHPIAQGVEDFRLEQEEMYGAPFDVPPAEVLVLQSYFPLGNEYFPCGICWTVGEGITSDFHCGPGGGVGQGQGVGRVFYFRPGHEAFRTYEDPNVRKVMYNAALWAGHKI